MKKVHQSQKFTSHIRAVKTNEAVTKYILTPRKNGVRPRYEWFRILFEKYINVHLRPGI